MGEWGVVVVTVVCTNTEGMVVTSAVTAIVTDRDMETVAAVVVVAVATMVVAGPTSGTSIREQIPATLEMAICGAVVTMVASMVVAVETTKDRDTVATVATVEGIRVATGVAMEEGAMAEVTTITAADKVDGKCWENKMIKWEDLSKELI